MVYDSQTKTFSVHQGVLDRVSVAAAIKREESNADMEIEDELGDFEDLEHSEELQQLRALIRHP